MNSWVQGEIVRGILPVAAIAGAVLYGLNGLFLEPQEAQLAQARARYTEAYKAAELNGTLRMAQSDLADQLEQSRQRVKEAMTRSKPATDQRELFEGITTVATEAGLELEQLRAMDWKPKANAAGTESACVGSACAVTLAGSYESLRAFVGTIESSLGFSCVTRLRVRSAMDGDRVRAELELVSVAADAKASAAALGAVTRVMEDGQ